MLTLLLALMLASAQESTTSGPIRFLESKTPLRFYVIPWTNNPFPRDMVPSFPMLPVEYDAAGIGVKVECGACQSDGTVAYRIGVKYDLSVPADFFRLVSREQTQIVEVVREGHIFTLGAHLSDFKVRRVTVETLKLGEHSLSAEISQ